MERGALRSHGDSTTAFQIEGEMLNETVGARAEGKSLQSVYDRVLLGTNRTIVQIKGDFNSLLQRHVFQRMYICLGVCKEGFKVGCRPIIGLYGCPLKSPYEGQLLLAIGLDANNMAWVIVYAQVEMETKDSWIWFFQLLVKDIELVNQYGFTFIRDKHKGLVEAFEAVVPNCCHRFCARHISTNFSLVYKGKMLKDAMWKVAFATTILEFRRAMEVLRTLDGEAYKWLTAPEKPPRHWSRCKPIISMMEEIRVKLMRRIHIRRNLMMIWDCAISPRPLGKLETNKKIVADCIAIISGKPKFQVHTATGDIPKGIENIIQHVKGMDQWERTYFPEILPLMQWQSHSVVSGVVRPLGSHGHKLRGPLELGERPHGVAHQVLDVLPEEERSCEEEEALHKPPNDRNQPGKKSKTKAVIGTSIPVSKLDKYEAEMERKNQLREKAKQRAKVLKEKRDKKKAEVAATYAVDSSNPIGVVRKRAKRNNTRCNNYASVQESQSGV
ncbi:unnamed protein product [Prunus armeniaca]